jgi:hypothetical protein
MFKELFTESSEYEVYFIGDNSYITLWLAYGDGSGTTKLVDKVDTYLTNKKEDKNYDSIVNDIVKKFVNRKKPLKSKGDSKLYKIPFYDLYDVQRKKYSDGGGKLDVWGGNIKPKKYVYMIVNQNEVITVISFFTRKGEADSWMRSLS